MEATYAVSHDLNIHFKMVVSPSLLSRRLMSNLFTLAAVSSGDSSSPTFSTSGGQFKAYDLNFCPEASFLQEYLLIRLCGPTIESKLSTGEQTVVLSVDLV